MFAASKLVREEYAFFVWFSGELLLYLVAYRTSFFIGETMLHPHPSYGLDSEATSRVLPSLAEKAEIGTGTCSTSS